MDSNTHSTSGPAGLAAVVAELAGAGRPGPRRAHRRRPGRAGPVSCGGWWTAWKASGWASWPRWMPAGRPGPSRAPGRLDRRLAAQPAADGRGGGRHGAVRTARALFRGPLTATAQALTDGEISPAHARCWPTAPTTCPTTWRPRPNRCWWRRPGGWTRRGCGGSWAICWRPPTPTAPRARPSGAMAPGAVAGPTLEGMVALHGLLEPEAGQIVLAALEPLARPADAADTRSGGQRRADALVELARRNLEAGQLPQSGGVRPQLLVTVDLDSLLGHHVPSVARLAGPDRWIPRRVGGWPVTVRSPGSWSPATPPPTPRPPRHRPRSPPTTRTTRTAWVTRRPDRPAPGGGQAAPPGPWWRPHPAAGGRPHHPGRHRRPTRRPGRPRRRLCLPRLCPAPGLV